MNPWSEIRDGTAVGPSVVIEVKGGAWIAQAVWSDEEGVGITVDMSPDVVLTKADLVAVIPAATALMATPPPVPKESMA